MRLLFVFVFLSSVAFGQLTVAEIIKINKMDASNFVSYCEKKGYKHSGEEKIWNYSRTKIVGLKRSMLKFDTENYNYVRHTTRSNGQIKIEYEIHGVYNKRKSEKIKSIKQQIKNIGFSINEREKSFSTCEYGNIYMRGKFEKMCVSYINQVFSIDYVVKRSSGKITLE